MKLVHRLTAGLAGQPHRFALAALGFFLAVILTIWIAGPATTITYSLVSLKAQVRGHEVSISSVLKASRAVQTKDYGVCVLAPQGGEVASLKPAVTIEATGTQYSDTLVLAAGTYQYFPCFDLGPTSVRLTQDSSTFRVGPAQGSKQGSPVGSAQQTLPSTRTGPVGVPGTWKSIFSDEFTGNSLNLSKWRPNWLAGDDSQITKPVNDHELSCYDPDNVKVRDGKLRLTVEERPCTDNRGKTYDYASGMIESADNFEFTYGFAETRMYFPPGRSCGPNWSAFWLNGERPGEGEIDVMECLKHDNVAWHYHSDEVDAGDTPDNWYDEVPATSDGWHTFGVDWRPGILDFYYDGVLVGTHREQVTATKHFLILNLATSGDTVKEETLKVDYVRVWQRS